MIHVHKDLAGYRITQTLHESSVHVVYRAIRLHDNRRVILKLPSADADLWELARLRNERDILRTLKVDGAVRLLDETRAGARLVLVFADSGGIAMDRLAQPLSPRSRGGDPAPFIEAAIAIAGALNNIHAAGVSHRDVNPSNVVYNTENRTVEIIDFGLATTLSEEAARSHTEGTILYQSPEQTGRTNLKVDYRTDLYSLGATLYALLLGQPPFTSKDPLELMHGHLARRPTAPAELGADEVLSDIVMKLLEKDPEQRYQSAAGLREDLVRRRDSGPGPFALGRRDTAAQLRLPQNLYGRDEARHTLQNALEESARGHATVVLIHGPAGVGKSSLVDELDGPLWVRNGALIRGKCDESHRNTPVFAFTQALRERVSQVLAGSEESLARHAATLRAALGQQGQLALDAIPELERIIGPQPVLPDLPLPEARMRREVLFTELLKASAAQSPLVLFLDDLQWADAATLSQVEALAAPDKATHLLLVLCWRDNEVGPGHPVQAAVDRIATLNPSLWDVTLRDLNEADIRQLLADTFDCAADEIGSLAKAVLRKTRGNPFFLRQFITTLNQDGLIRYEPSARRWLWDLDRIAESNMTDNVADLLTRRLLLLPPETREALQVAACVGASFDLGQLAVALDRSAQEILGALRPALQEGWLIDQDAGLQWFAAAADAAEYGGTQTDLQAAASRTRLRFLHDRVQQAAAEMIDAAHARRLHLTLGRRLRERLDKTAGDAAWFEAVSHFNEAIELIEDLQERMAVAAVNLEAARRAIRAAAHENALVWLQAALTLLGSEGWHERRDLTMDVHLYAARAASLTDDGERLASVIADALAHARTPFERARILEVQIDDANARRHYDDVIRIGREALSLLGYSVPRRSSRLLLAWQTMRVVLDVFRVGIDRLAELPPVTAPEHHLISRLLVTVSTATGLTRRELIPHLSLSLVEQSLRHGLSAESPIGFSVLGVGLILGTGQIDLAVRLARVSLALAERAPDSPSKFKGQFAAQHMIMHWKEPMRPIAEWTRDQASRYIQFGDFGSWTLLAWGYTRMTYQCGVDLRTVRDELDRMTATHERIYHLAAPPYWALQRHIIDTLMEGDGVLDGPGFKLSDFLAEAREKRDYISLWTCACEQAWMHLAFDRPLEALPYLAELEKTLFLSLTFPEVPVYHHLNAMVRLAALKHTPAGERRASRRSAMRSYRLLRRWARKAPSNHAHRVYMIEGLLAAHDGRVARAADAFESAITLASENGFLQDEALALDLTARFHAAIGRERQARHHRTEARRAWRRWGAEGPARQIESRHLISTDSTRTTAGERPHFDVMSVMKASHMISSEIRLPQLMQRLVAIALENAGAQRGFLVLDDDGRLMIEAEGDVQRLPMVTLGSRPMEEGAALATSIINYVARTREAVMIEEAAKDMRFAADPYVWRGSVRSVLCTPIVFGAKLVGVMYVENNHSAGAFTADRQEILRTISAQAAISYENARLYSELDEHRRTLENRVRERTDELYLKNERLEETLTRLEQAQDQILAQQKLAYLGTMVAGIAHEIKNPLNFVMNFSEVLNELIGEVQAILAAQDGAARRAVARTLDTVVETSRRIREHGDRIDRVVKAMLLHAGKSTGVWEVTDFNGLVVQSVDLARHGASEPGLRAVNVSLSLDADIPPVRLAPRDVARAVLNVVTNGLQAAAARGNDARLDVITEYREGRGVVRIRDNGNGIAPDVQERIFAPFFTTRPSGQGTGLGLSITWDIIVGQHGGQIRVESEAGRYAEFIIELPIGPAADEER